MRVQEKTGGKGENDVSCCGQKRLALGRDRSTDSEPPATVTAANVAVPGFASPRGPRDVMLRYLAPGSFSTRSVHTGRAYGCTRTNAVLAVASLLATRLFARA